MLANASLQQTPDQGRPSTIQEPGMMGRRDSGGKQLLVYLYINPVLYDALTCNVIAHTFIIGYLRSNQPIDDVVELY